MGKYENDKQQVASNFMGFVLFKEPVFNSEEFEKSFSEEWGITLCEGEEDISENSDKDSDVDSRVYGVDSMLLVLGYMGFPVPDGEAEANAQLNYMWPDAVTVTQTHKAHTNRHKLQTHFQFAYEFCDNLRKYNTC